MRHGRATGNSKHGVVQIRTRGGWVLPGAIFEMLGGAVFVGGIVFAVAIYGLATDDRTRNETEIANASSVDRQPLYGLAFSSDGRIFATFSRDEDILVYDTQSGKPVACLESSDAAPSSFALSQDGNRLVASYYDLRVMVWDNVLSDPQPTVLGLAHAHVRSMALSYDGTLAATGDVEGNLVLWDVQHGGEPVIMFGHQSGVHSVALSPDGSRVLTGGGDGICSLRLVATGSELQRFSGHYALVNSVAISPDGRQIASCGVDRTVRVWDVASGKELWSGLADLYSTRTVEFSPDGRMIASGGVDKTVKLWDAQTGRQLAAFHGHEKGVSRVRFLPSDSSRVVSAGYDGTIRFWNQATGSQFRCIVSE